MSGVAALDQRNRQTVRTTCGVRTNPGHWANATTHAFCRWADDTTLTTWCGLTVRLSDGGRQTTDLISCLTCAQASYDTLWGKR